MYGSWRSHMVIAISTNNRFVDPTLNKTYSCNPSHSFAKKTILADRLSHSVTDITLIALAFYLV